jgi:predicted ABC-type ATPase
LHEGEHLQHIADPQARSEAARLWADARRGALLKAGQSFVSETVFSHESKLALIAEAQQQGFLVMLLIVCVDDPKHLLKRVANRFIEGGHDVPVERILARYPRTLANLAVAVRIADIAVLYDSYAVAAGTHTAVAVCKKEWTQKKFAPLPEWARVVLGK